MNSIDIDLLPWREALRERRRQSFYAAFGGVLIAAALVAGAGWWWLDRLLERQNERNRFLEQAIAQLDRELGEIRSLESLVAGILARKEVIEALQLRRVEPIVVTDELPRLLPEGVALTALERKDGAVTLQGVARSNGIVSELMRQIDRSPYFDAVRLIETQAAQVAGQSGVKFSLAFAIERPAIEARIVAPPQGERAR